MPDEGNRLPDVKRLACITCGSTDFELHSLNKEDIDALCSQCWDTVSTMRSQKNERGAWFGGNED